MVLLDPQPNEISLVEMKRYYAKLQRDPKYEKRISWFKKLLGYSPEVLSRAVAEYLGKFPIEEKCRHRNSKKTNQEYVRSSPANKNKIRSDLESGKTVKQTFSDNFQSLEHQPHHSKFVENMKYNLDKAKDPGNKQNAADDIINDINMIRTSHPFLKEIVQTTGKPPNLICYTENQLKHFLSALKTSVIGVDRTFNLRPCFVTTTVF